MRTAPIVSPFFFTALVTSFLHATPQLRDSLADVFPLAVGNQWTFGYDYNFGDIGVLYQMRDTGAVTVRVVGSDTEGDTARWQIYETGVHWTQMNNQPWTGPLGRTDSFEVVEVRTGRHRLHRTGDPANVRRSVLPLLSNLTDTGHVNRFMPVDSQGTVLLNTAEDPPATILVLRFRRDVGLTSSYVCTAITGFPYYSTTCALQNYSLTGVFGPSDSPIPSGYHLEQNFPNPFNATTRVVFNVGNAGMVTLRVFDLLGREAATLVNGQLTAGRHTATFNGASLSSGVYLYRLEATSAPVLTRTMVLLK